MATGTRSSSSMIQFDGISGFFGELRRRRVWRSALTYAAAVFVALQLGEIVFPVFGAPPWAMRLLVVACFLGLPVVLALAWVFDITSAGIQKTVSDEAAPAAGGYAGTTLPKLALLGVTLATVAGVGWWTVQDTLGAQASEPAASPEATVTAASVEDAPLQIRSLAVLPLQDFSEEEGGEYFTAGFHEELVSQLSQIAAARVLSRTSVVQYDASGKSMPTIAQELGVEGVVEGSVFRDGNRVRITVQLIHGATDQHLWANSYDGTLEDAIGLQRTVAQAIAKEIQAELFPEEEWATPQTRVAATPTVQEEYLKGRYAQSQATTESLEEAVVHFEAALQEDSTFAPAYVGLAGANFLLGYQRGDSTSVGPSGERQVVVPLTRALRLDRESPEAQAMLVTLKEHLGEIPGIQLPEGLKIVGDSLSELEAEIALSATEFGRQFQRIMVRNKDQNAEPVTRSHAQRLATARRLQAATEYPSAERLIRSVIDEAPGSREAWDALEDLKTAQGDFQGAAEVREERIALHARAPEEEASVRELEQQMAREGEHGYWSWRMKELEARKAKGEPVSPVLLARAYVGAHQTDQALQQLNQALLQKDVNLATLWTDPAWDSIRSDPRFRRILAEARQVRREEESHPRDWF